MKFKRYRKSPNIKKRETPLLNMMLTEADFGIKINMLNDTIELSNLDQIKRNIIIITFNNQLSSKSSNSADLAGFC